MSTTTETDQHTCRRSRPSLTRRHLIVVNSQSQLFESFVSAHDQAELCLPIAQVFPSTSTPIKVMAVTYEKGQHILYKQRDGTSSPGQVRCTTRLSIIPTTSYRGVFTHLNSLLHWYWRFVLAPTDSSFALCSSSEHRPSPDQTSLKASAISELGLYLEPNFFHSTADIHAHGTADTCVATLPPKAQVHIERTQLKGVRLPGLCKGSQVSLTPHLYAANGVLMRAVHASGGVRGQHRGALLLRYQAGRKYRFSPPH